jgi:amino acid transporter
MHFLVYGILTTAGLAWRRRRAPRRSAGLVSRGKLVLAAGAVTLFCLAAFYWPIDAFVTSFVPAAGRWLLVAVLVVGLLPYFLADEWLTRGGEARISGPAIRPWPPRPMRSSSPRRSA